MPDPLSPTGIPGLPQPLVAAPVSSPPQSPSAPERVERADSARSQVAEAARMDESLVRRVGRDKPNQPPLSLDEAIQEFRQFLKNLPSDLQFSKDETTGTVVFKIVNPVTKEVVRQFPPEEILQVARRLKQVAKGTDASGMLIDRKS